jgi:hypothetical protein
MYAEVARNERISDPHLILSAARAFRVILATEPLDLKSEVQLWVQSHFEFGPERLHRDLSFAVPVAEWGH